MSLDPRPRSPHVTGACGIDTAHSDEDHYLTADEALRLRAGDEVRVRRYPSKRFFRGIVTGTPTQVAQWVLVGYRLASRSYGATANTYSRHEHFIQLGGDPKYDAIERG